MVSRWAVVELLIAVAVASVGPALADSARNPGYSCSGSLDPAAQFVCGDDELSRASLELSQAYYAVRGATDPSLWLGYKQQAVQFLRMALRNCEVPSSGSVAPERLSSTKICMMSDFQRQRTFWIEELKRLNKPEALEEALRDPDDNIRLQQALKNQGWLPVDAEIDGVFGEGTRQAIRRMQASKGMPVNGLLSESTKGAATAGLSLTVQHIVIEGREKTPEALLRAAIGEPEGTPILTFSVNDARTRIEQIPWVRSAVVELVLPGTIRIVLNERRPFAVWQNQGKFALIDRVGNVVTDSDVGAFADKLPLVVGVGAPLEAAKLIDTLNNYPELSAKLVAAVRVGERRWNLCMTGGANVLLPEGADTPALAKLQELENSKQILDQPLQEIDMRLPDRFSVRPMAGHPCGQPHQTPQDGKLDQKTVQPTGEPENRDVASWFPSRSSGNHDKFCRDKWTKHNRYLDSEMFDHCMKESDQGYDRALVLAGKYADKPWIRETVNREARRWSKGSGRDDSMFAFVLDKITDGYDEIQYETKKNDFDAGKMTLCQKMWDIEFNTVMDCYRK